MSQSSPVCNIDQFRSYLYELARTHLGRRLQCQIDASDLMQQTLLDAHANKGQFQGQTDAQRAAWLRQILAHNLEDALRHYHRAKRDVSRQRSLEVAIRWSSPFAQTVFLHLVEQRLVADLKTLRGLLAVPSRLMKHALNDFLLLTTL